MAIDITTIILTAVCTGIGIPIGNGIFEIFFKDYLKKIKKQNDLLKKLRKKLSIYKRPWLASLLNFFIWGSGYLYIKKKRLLGVILFIIQLFIIAGYSLNQGAVKTLFEALSTSFLTILVAVYISIDAYKIAREINKENGCN